MSFYTIETPGNREEEVKKYLQLREYLRAKDSIDKTGKYERKKELLKTYKPLLKPIVQPLADIKSKVETLPQDIGKMTGEEFTRAIAALPAPVANIYQEIPPMIQTEQTEKLEEREPQEIEKIKINITGDEEQDEIIKDIQDKEAREFFRFENNEFFIGDDKVTIKPGENKINYKDTNYNLSPELLTLLITTGESPVKSKYFNKKYYNKVDEIKERINEDGTTDDYAINAYRKIINDSGLLHFRTYEGHIRPNDKLVKNKVWSKILKPVYDKFAKETRAKEKQERKKQKEAQPSTSTSGQGIKSTKNKTVFLSSNPDKLADRLTLLCASQKAGNTGVNNEIVDICNELINMRVMTRQQKNKILKEYKP